MRSQPRRKESRDILRPRSALKPMTATQKAFAKETFDRLKVPEGERDDFLDAIAGLIEAALDAHEEGRRYTAGAPRS